MMNLAIFLSQPTIPWAAINHVIGAINYGGRVTDDFDRRCLLATLQQYISPAIMAANASFTPSLDYTCPAVGTLDSYRSDHRVLG
jgi:dynein heavy chain